MRGSCTLGCHHAPPHAISLITSHRLIHQRHPVSFPSIHQTRHPPAGAVASRAIYLHRLGAALEAVISSRLLYVAAGGGLAWRSCPDGEGCLGLWWGLCWWRAWACPWLTLGLRRSPTLALLMEGNILLNEWAVLKRWVPWAWVGAPSPSLGSS